MPEAIISDELIEAYSATAFHVFASPVQFSISIGRHSPELESLFASLGKSSAAFITAENPFSEATSPEENSTNQERLRVDLAALGATTVEGEGRGQDPAWPPEASLLAIGITYEQACELGRKYRQNAIVWVGDNANPELVLLV